MPFLLVSFFTDAYCPAQPLQSYKTSYIFCRTLYVLKILWKILLFLSNIYFFINNITELVTTV
jgi:hypothetical protein